MGGIAVIKPAGFRERSAQFRGEASFNSEISEPRLRRLSAGRAATLLILALWAVPVNAQSTPQEKVYQWSLVAAGAAHCADIASTADCAARGTCHEANPALRWADESSVSLGLAKGALAGTLHLVIHRALWKRGHKWQAIVANVAVIGVTAAVTARNARY